MAGYCDLQGHIYPQYIKPLSCPRISAFGLEILQLKTLPEVDQPGKLSKPRYLDS